MGCTDTESMRPVSLLDPSSDMHRSPRHPLPQILQLLGLHKRTMSIARMEVPHASLSLATQILFAIGTAVKA
jgi:hypothetical protein